MTLTVAVTDNIADAAALAPQWERLRAVGASAIYTSPAWCLTAWKAFPDLGSPRLVTVVNNGTLLGLLPLTWDGSGTGDSLSWAGWPLGDEHDARIGPACRQDEVAAALLNGVAAASGAATTPRLPDVRSASVLTMVAGSQAGCPAPILQLREPDSQFGPFACLPGWSRDRRRRLRSARRRLADTGTVEVERITEPSRLADALPRFVTARIDAWRQRGRLGELPVMDRHACFPDFITAVACELGAHGQCYLAAISVDGDPVAQSLLFRARGADLLYMSSYRPDMARFGPSHLLLAEIAAAAVADGVRVIELGRGDEPYKFGLGADRRYLRDLLPHRLGEHIRALLVPSPV